MTVKSQQLTDSNKPSLPVSQSPFNLDYEG